VADYQIGRVIGAAFGLVFVEANAGALPTGVAIPLRVLAIGGFLAVLLGRGRWPVVRTGGGFGRGYWGVVAAELVALVGGLMVISGVLHAHRATLPWIAFVVGVHFFGLAAVWRLASMRVLGAAMAVCGAVGLALAACGESAAVIATVAGVVPGALLLGHAWRPTRT
jgi:uncharacterized membrane protein